MASRTTSTPSSGFEDSSFDDEYESDSDPIAPQCFPLFRQTASVRYTRTTSRVQQHAEAREEKGESTSHLFGCLRRISSSQTVMYEEIASQTTKATTPIPKVHRSRNEEAEVRRQELERTRREVKRLDQLLDEHRKEETSRFSHSSRPDSWISQLSPTEKDDADDDPGSSCFWSCCCDDKSWPPHVDLEQFSGEPKDWPDFILRYKELIHDAMPNDSLRMIYLEELLPPMIKKDYTPFFRRPECYRPLLVRLRDQYGSPDLVVRSCLSALKELPPMNPSDPRTVTVLSRQVQAIVTTLRKIGCESELRAFSTLEFTCIVKKLSDPLRNSWMRYIRERPSPLPLPNLGDFALWLQERASWLG